MEELRYDGPDYYLRNLELVNQIGLEICYEVGGATSTKKKEKLTVLFIGKSIGPKLRNALERGDGNTFSDSDWLVYIYIGSNKTRFQYCKNSQDVLLYTRANSRTHWKARDRA